MLYKRIFLSILSPILLILLLNEENTAHDRVISELGTILSLDGYFGEYLLENIHPGFIITIDLDL